MKRYTTYTRKYKDQMTNKQIDKMFDSMGEMFSMFNSSTVTEEENKTIIKRGDKTIVIDKDGNVTINGKQMVEMCDKPYDPYNCTAADAKIHNDLNKVVEEHAIKLYNIYWYIGLSFVMSCSLAILISIAILHK